jgi:Secretion system C-terminal sorting domain
MKPIFFTILFFLQLSEVAFGQAINPPTLFASASANAQSISFGTLDWSIGETVVDALKSGSGLQLTQGFHQVFASISTSVEEIENGVESSIRVFPNPTSGWVQIESNGAIKFRILNILGNELVKSAGFSENPLVDLGQIPSGLYMLEIFEKDQPNIRFFKLEVIR